MDSAFARAQLAKFGWKDGDGLGRTQSGRTAAVKVNNKQDTAGVGHQDHAFGFDWFDHVFNKAAKNIKIVKADSDDEEGGVQVATERKLNRHDIVSTVKPAEFVPASKRAPLKYGAFVSSAAAASGSDSDSEDDFHRADYSKRVTDEELLAACGGTRIGQRGSYRQDGKLARLERAEALARSVSPSPAPADGSAATRAGEPDDDEERAHKRSKKHKKDRSKRDKHEAGERLAGEDEAPAEEAAEEDKTERRREKKAKKNKKDKRGRDNEEEEEREQAHAASEPIEERQSRKRRKHDRQEHEQHDEATQEEEQAPRKKSKKSKRDKESHGEP